MLLQCDFCSVAFRRLQCAKCTLWLTAHPGRPFQVQRAAKAAKPEARSGSSRERTQRTELKFRFLRKARVLEQLFRSFQRLDELVTFYRTGEVTLF